MIRLSALAPLALLLVTACACSPSEGAPEDVVDAGQHVTARPDTWAAPLPGNPGLPNFFQVDERLYRGAQPEDEGFATLKALGVKTVVNLRSFNSDRDECEENGLAYVHIYSKAWHPEDEDVLAFLRTATDPDRQPVFFHCQHGADRTGTMCAVYRLVVQGWTKDEAIAEMTTGGYGFHSIWQDLIEYVRELDVEKMRREAGL